MTTTSMYSTFIDHTLDSIRSRAAKANRDGDGMGWGHDDHTLREAAADMHALVVCELDDGLLCELSDRLYLLVDNNGPWALEVATQLDLE